MTKPLTISLSYDEEFVTLMDKLRHNYPPELFDLDGIGKQLDMHRFAKEFYNISGGAAADASIDPNANVAGRDVITYTFEMPKAFHRLNSYYLLWNELRKVHGKVVAGNLITAQVTGDIYINDAWDVGRPYCFNFSCYDIALQGLPMGDRVKPLPPKSLYAFVRQVEQFVVYAANSTLGATGLADLFIVMAWYCDRIKDSGLPGVFSMDHKIVVGHASEYVREIIASLVYTLNWQFRGNQSPFTNVSVYDRPFLEELVPHYTIDGVCPKIETVQEIQRMYLDIMNTELSRAALTFPVTTACFAVEDDEIVDEDFLAEIAAANLKFGFINIYCGASSTLSSCCRLRSDGSGLGYANSFGAGSTKIGSLGVVTLNLPRLAYTAAGSVHDFMVLVREHNRSASNINEAKRTIVRKRVERGNLPLYTMGHMDLSRQYNTVGLTGLYEAYTILGAPGEYADFAERVIELVNGVNANNEKVTGSPHNCEQVPAESSAVKLVQKDRLLVFDPGVDFYSNQFVPLGSAVDVLQRIRIQGRLDKHFSGGSILHVNVDEPLTDGSQMEELIRYCAREGVVYWAVNYALQQCEDDHVTVGKDEVCSCGKPVVRHLTRVVGFLTDQSNWNKTRREHDWPTRQFYKPSELPS